MQRNDGGNFSNDPIARLIAMKLGSMPESELAKQEQIPQDAINLASNVVGSINKVGKGIKLIPSEYDVEKNIYKKAAEKSPSFFDKIKANTQEYVNPNIDAALANDAEEAVKQEIKNEQFNKIKGLFGK